MKSVTAMLHLLILVTATTAILGAPRGKRAVPCTQNATTYTCRRPTADCPCLFQQAATEREDASYTLKIHLPKNIQVTQPWVGFYHGKPIEFDGPSFAWALLPEHTVYGKPLRHNDEPAGIFSLIITPQVTFMAEGNTIQDNHNGLLKNYLKPKRRSSFQTMPLRFCSILNLSLGSVNLKKHVLTVLLLLALSPFRRSILQQPTKML
jgi:hypothetical protein